MDSKMEENVPERNGVEVPDEILLKVFEYLPVGNLCAAGRVSKQWERVAADKKLWRNAAITPCILDCKRCLECLEKGDSSRTSLTISVPNKAYKVHHEGTTDFPTLTEGVLQERHVNALTASFPNLVSLKLQNARIKSAAFLLLPPGLNSLEMDSCFQPDCVRRDAEERIVYQNLTNISVRGPPYCLQSRQSQCFLPDYLLKNVQTLAQTDGCVDNLYRTPIINSTQLKEIDLSQITNCHHNHNLQLMHMVLDNYLYLSNEICSQMRVLNMSNRWIPSYIVCVVLGRFEHLEELHLKGCRMLDDSAFEGMNPSHGIKVLDIQGCSKITRQAIRAFQSKYPACVVRF